MLKFFAKRALKNFTDRYGYDVSYMRFILETSPPAFMKFSRLTGLAQHCEAAPRNAIYAAKLVGAIAEDCGPCTQLAVNMAQEAGVPDVQIEAVLTRDCTAMDEDTALGFRFAEAVVHRGANADVLRESVRTQWGDAGVIDLTLGAQLGRIFPMIKEGLGYAKSCARIRVADADIDVVKRAA